MNYEHFNRLTKEDLRVLITALKPHLKGSLYQCSKRDLVGELISILKWAIA